MKNLKKFFNTLSEIEFNQLINEVKIESHNKGNIILRQNEISKFEIFVEEGTLRSFVPNNQGDDKTVAFFCQGEFINTYNLRTIQGRSIYYYETLNKSKIILFESRRLNKFFQATKNLNAMADKIIKIEAARLYKREKCIAPIKAKDKYFTFLQYHPQIEQLIPQLYIASYLGITHVTFSRLKKQLILEKLNK